MSAPKLTSFAAHPGGAQPASGGPALAADAS